MAKYIAIWYQNGGCDYTIGCGVAVRHLEAADRDAALASIVEELSQPRDGDREIGIDDETADSLERIELFEIVDSATVPPTAWKAKRAQLKAAAAEAAREQKERAELDRLRKKYEGTQEPKR